MTPRTPAALRAASLMLLPLALAACSSGTDSAAGSVSTKPAATTSPATASPAAKAARLLTGDKLRAVLLRGDVLPKGYRANADATRDSGLELAPESEDGAPGACGALEQTGWIRIAGIESAAFAQGDFLNPKREEFSQEVDTFRGAGAQTVMTRIQQAFTRCAHFTDSDSGAPVPVKVKSGPIAGSNGQSIKAVLTSDHWEGGTTLIATRVGNSVITTFYAVQSADLGAAGVAFTEKIAKNLTIAQR
ncbi:hypothetical protein [Streptomyces sp. H39-S7]|uniref:hypothetical protein n=1 Tax=Streptomyces sp. H39-S7 TaxID=3004357 RepID=UPI0022B01551|nr:hypothetical protein [Streptomyces sp. H39-S7]MCZ4122887.1 hypothetical protein [Streptomyces sp. H39-S7]